MRRFRLLSHGGIEIGMQLPGVIGDNSFLDTLLMDNPHKVATISIPFSDNTVLDFAKYVTNPGRQISKAVATRINAVNEVLGLNVGHFDVESRASMDAVGNDVMEIENDEDTESKYIIKIEFEQQIPNNQEVAEAAVNQPLNMDRSVTNQQTILHNSTLSSQCQQTDTSYDDHEEVQNNDAEDNSYLDATNDNSEYIYLETNSREDESSISLDNIVPLEHDQVQQIIEEDCYDNYTEAEFSFRDFDEYSTLESSQHNSIHSVEMTNRAIGTVFRNIIQNSQSSTAFSPSSLTSIPQPSLVENQDQARNLDITSPDTLRLRFVKTGLFLIKDITKKRKRKRGF